jgi:RNA polymerase sigma factor (sigma-70 family)
MAASGKPRSAEDRTPASRLDATSIRLRRAVEGDRDSAGWIVAHFDPFVVAQVRMRLGPALAGVDEIRDLVDEVWLVTLTRFKDLRARDSRLTPVLLRFLVTTSFNLCNNHLRRAIAEKGRQAPRAAKAEPSSRATPSIAQIAARQAGVPTSVSLREISAMIGAALDALEPDKVEVLVLRLIEQRTNAEIATLLGIPSNTVAVRYRRALEKLRAALPASVFGDVLALRRSG